MEPKTTPSKMLPILKVEKVEKEVKTTEKIIPITTTTNKIEEAIPYHLKKRSERKISQV